MNRRIQALPAARSMTRHRHAATLVELIAAVAIVALLAALLLPAFIKRVDLTTRAQEAATLAAIRDALLLSVTRTETVPDHTTWPTAAAGWSKLPATQITTNPRRHDRVYFLQSAPNPGSLPYAQTVVGTTQPANLRAILVSILAGDRLNATNCPNPSGGTLSDADFTALWNTPDGERPTAGAWANWNGMGEDFLVQRLDYAPLFHRLVLLNRDALYPWFNINGSSGVAVTNNPANNVGWQAYYLDGTIVGLADTNGTMQTRQVLNRDVSFVYEDGFWRAQVKGLSTGNYLADDFSDKAGAFLAAAWYTGAFKGADQQSALVAMYTFMYTFTLWANQWPHFPSHGISSAEQVPEYLLLKSIADPSKPLDGVTGEQGLLK